MHKYQAAEWILTTFDEMVVRHFLSISDCPPVKWKVRKVSRESVSQAGRRIGSRQLQVPDKLTNAELVTGTMHY